MWKKSKKVFQMQKSCVVAGIFLCCMGSLLFTACQNRNTASDPVPKTSEKVSGQSEDSQENQGEDGKGSLTENGNGIGVDDESSDTESLIDPAGNFKMEVEDGDLQQCADSVIRLYAEYFYQSKQYDKMDFHLVNGFSVEYSKWRQGMRVSVDGNSTSWVSQESPSDSKQSFEKYLRFVFAYASTLSVEKESKEIEKEQFHVLKNPLHEDDPWYYVSELEYPLQTPEYSFGQGSLRRPEYDE